MVTFTTDQQYAIDVFQNKQSLLICGGGGNGKSFVTRSIADICKEEDKSYVLCSTTGTSAINIGGRTLHSVFGLKPWIKDYEEHARKLMSDKRNKSVYDKLKTIKVLIVDEVSMLDNILCEGISTILKTIRFSHKPFGGIQVVFVGDLLQLPPVENTYCFLSKSFKELKPTVVELKQVIRQAGDTTFQKVLETVRRGKITDEIHGLLENLKNTQFPENIMPTKLYPVNCDVDKINNAELAKLKASGKKSIVYQATFNNIPQSTQDHIKKDYTVELCVGAQVMITRNINIAENLVNGSRGFVKNLDANGAIVQLVDGSVHSIIYAKDDLQNKKSVSFLPLKLAYAITIHKAQGATLDAIELDLGKKIFQCGQAYTGLSRARTMKSVKITDLSAEIWKADPLVIEWLQSNTY